MPGFWDLLTPWSAAAERSGPQPGQTAPDFELPASDGRVYRLSTVLTEHKFVVLAWFPMAFTPVCTLECRSIGKAADLIGNYDAALFAASLDSVEQNRRFARMLGLDFPILSDPHRTVAKAYGVAGDRGMSRRWTFYIGPERKIAHLDKQVSSLGHGRSIADTLARLGAPRRTGGAAPNVSPVSTRNDV